MFRNNGDTFTEKDWMRLQRIGVSTVPLSPTYSHIFPRSAEGNPTPEKIGAFGVGG